MSSERARTWAYVGAATVAVVAIAAALVLLAPRDDGAPAAPERVEMNVTTYRYEYEPGSDVAISVPLGAEVVLHVTSTDVTHGFAIEGYGINEEIPAGETVTIRFRAAQAGDFRIYCTVFCGSGHPEHQGTFHVA